MPHQSPVTPSEHRVVTLNEAAKMLRIAFSNSVSDWGRGTGTGRSIFAASLSVTTRAHSGSQGLVRHLEFSGRKHSTRMLEMNYLGRTARCIVGHSHTCIYDKSTPFGSKSSQMELRVTQLK